jgi:hypothetical protein
MVLLWSTLRIHAEKPFFRAKPLELLNCITAHGGFLQGGNCLRAKQIAICLFILCIAVNVSGQTNQYSNNDGGWVVAAYLGGARTVGSDLIISQPVSGTNLTFEDVRLSSPRLLLLTDGARGKSHVAAKINSHDLFKS